VRYIFKLMSTPQTTWTVEVTDKAAEEIAALPADLQARLVRMVELVEAVGMTKMAEPHVKHLQGKLWEMRMKGKDGIARALYVTASGKRVVIVLAFVKKTQKTPPAVIRLALKRAEEVE
jgi:phage-related protein